MAYTTTGYDRFRTPFRFHVTPWVKRLLIANAVVFLVDLIVGQNLLADWMGFARGDLLARPWGVVTYMFVHGGFGHLFWNMVGLFFFGPRLEERWGSNEFIKYYLICGVGGAVLSMLFSPVPVIGASAAIYGIMLAFAMLWPDAPIYLWGILPVKAKWLVGFLVTVSLFYGFAQPPSGGGGVAHFAHLGGFLAGFAYLKWDVRPQSRAGTPRKKKPRRLAIVPRDPGAERSARAEKRTNQEDDRALLDRVDAVLDKISEEGIESLTDAEKSLLDEVSRRHRTN